MRSLSLSLMAQQRVKMNLCIVLVLGSRNSPQVWLHHSAVRMRSLSACSVCLLVTLLFSILSHCVTKLPKGWKRLQNLPPDLKVLQTFPASLYQVLKYSKPSKLTNMWESSFTAYKTMLLKSNLSNLTPNFLIFSQTSLLLFFTMTLTFSVLSSLPSDNTPMYLYQCMCLPFPLLLLWCFNWFWIFWFLPKISVHRAVWL